MDVILNAPPLISPCEMKGSEMASDADTVSTGNSPSSSLLLDKQMSSSSSSLSSSDRDRSSPPMAPTSSSTPSPKQRRSIFNSYWRSGNSSSNSFREENSGGLSSSPGRQQAAKRSTFEPSYLGVYQFSPVSPVPHNKPPALSPISSTDSLTPSSNVLPKSILRRRRSFQPCRVSPVDCRPSLISASGRPRSVSCIGPELEDMSNGGRPRSLSCHGSELDINPPPFLDDLSESGSQHSRTTSSSREPQELKRQHSFVHFDPTITVRECVDEEPQVDQESNWFSENELRGFMAETVNLCQHSAVTAVRTYSLPSVKKAYEAAHEAGVKSPILSSTFPEHRALFADPVLHADPAEDAIVHDGSKRFFKIVSKEMQRVLLVDTSSLTLKLFQRHILSMFPHVHIDTAMSGEDALDKIEVDPKRSGLNYDMIIVEERLQQGLSSGDANCECDESTDLTGSELLRLVNEMESTIALTNHNATKQEWGTTQKKTTPRRSLKIGVSVSLGEDCESLRNKGGADLFWSKPSPKPSNGLRNQIMNTLMNKRGKSVYICGC